MQCICSGKTTQLLIRKGFLLFNKRCSGTQMSNMPRQEIAVAILQVNGEEPAAAGDRTATIIRHVKFPPHCQPKSFLPGGAALAGPPGSVVTG